MTRCVRQIWECSKCGHRETTPVTAIEVTCPTLHSHGRHTVMDLHWPMTLIWDKESGGPKPKLADA